MAELRPSGFPEYSPAQQLIFDKVKAIIEQNYQQFGYTHIHTPAVERSEVLLSKSGDETGKQIYGLYGMAQGAEDLKDYGLHFDLTVPFARYTLDREHQLTFPFKRYQIQPVWRGERAQKGRFREFFQCDIDVIWKGEKEYLYYDAEIIATLAQTLDQIFQATQLKDEAIFHINNKKIVKAFLAQISNNEEQAQAISNLIDKVDKIGLEKFTLSLEELGIDQSKREKILNFIAFSSSDLADLDQLAQLSDDTLFQEGIIELQKVISLLDAMKTNLGIKLNYLIDMKIIRGLDYYTGTIFEATFAKENVGSICGGGRYANLTGYIDPKRQEYCGVGGSIGISRILSRIFDTFPVQKATTADYLILYFDGEKQFEIGLQLAKILQEQGKNFEIYPTPEKLGKQFAYADKKGIPFVIICGEGEYQQGIYKIKNMQTGEETTVPLG